MTEESYYKNKFSHGGFFPDNIRKWIIDECLASGDPMRFFWCIQDVVDDLANDEYFDKDWETQ